MNYTTLSEQIRKLRLSKKFTLAVMAERLGVTTSAVAAYENGSRNPSFDVLVKIARIFNVTVDNLLEGDKKDLIDVSGLIPEQRDSVVSLIEIYRKFNFLVNETLGLNENERNLKGYFESDLEDFKVHLDKRQEFTALRKEMDKKIHKKYSKNQEETEELSDDQNIEDIKVKHLEDRIKVLEDMIKNNQK